MILSSKDLPTFLKLATERMNSEKVSIFFTEKPAYPSLTTGGFPSEKNHMEFVYLLLSSTYQAIFQGHVKKQGYGGIKKTLSDFFEVNKDKLTVTEFDTLTFDFSKGTIFVSAKE